MNRRRELVSTVATTLALLMPATAFAQNREPLCVDVGVRRLAASPQLAQSGTQQVVLAALPATSSAAFVVGVLDPARALESAPRAGAAATSAGPRPDAQSTPLDAQPSAHAPGLSLFRVDASLLAVGPAIRITAGVDSQPVAATVSGGVMVLFRSAGNLSAALVPSSGDPGAVTTAATAPAPVESGVRRGFTWHTIAARGDGAIALAGTDDGQVVALRFDARGARVGEPIVWPRRVGGSMQLLPMASGPAAAMLARPVPGTGPNNEPARAQVLVHLDEGLQPVRTPAALGLAQFPLASVVRGHDVVVFQWALEQGLAIATLPIAGDRIGEQLPRLWRAEPPLEGAHVGHSATVGPDNVLYDVALYADANGSVRGHVAWVPPSGTPIFRRDVIATRGRLVAQPQVLPARDGVVVVLALEDETGGALDAHHVRCDLVSLEH